MTQTRGPGSRRAGAAIALIVITVLGLPAPASLGRPAPAKRAAAETGVTVKKFGSITFKDTTTSTGDPLQLKLDVYVPQGPGMSGPWPAMVMLHGGGWADGTRSDVSGKAQDFAA